jgi:uncharacterized membrane protein YsdA (DUF1294 family)
MLDTNILFYLIIVFLVINLLAFLVMIDDKMKSRRAGAERISEGKMFFLAAIFGALGVYIGMFTVRHKTRKWYFLIGIPLLFLENISTLYLAYLLLLNY